jgi:hypothetical protein
MQDRTYGIKQEATACPKLMSFHINFPWKQKCLVFKIKDMITVKNPILGYFSLFTRQK